MPWIGLQALARKRENGVTLPEGVEKATVRKKSGKAYTYYYWNPGRGTDRQGERIKLPNADTNPRAFWTEIERRQRSKPTAFPPGSIGYLVEQYRASDEFTRLAEGTRSNYEVTMRRMEEKGLVRIRDLTPLVVQTARDAMKDTPVMANQTLSVGRTIFDWAIPLGLAATNPFEKVRNFEIPDRGHVPWPTWIVDRVRTQAYPDLVRMVELGIMTCQRGSDLIRMGPGHRDRNGLWCRPKKTRARRRSFHIPLATADALAIDRWAETPMTFTNPRWLKPIARHREDLYLYSPKGAQYTADGLRARWGRWLAETDEGRELCNYWKAWVAGQIRKYDWDIDPEDADHPTIHGLRGTGILARAEQGYDVDQIANDIGMSRQNVQHYMRFKDQMKVGADGQKRLRVVSGPKGDE
jgi:integrase